MSMSEAKAREAPLTADEQLAAWLARGQDEVFTVIAPVGPALAYKLLERNKDNRTVRERGAANSVEAYKAAMARGEWRINGQALIVSRDGELNDGQHRLWAVVGHGQPVMMQLTFGVDRDSRHTIDQGIRRSPGDILAMAGEKNVNHLAKAVHFVWWYDEHRYPTDRPSPEQLKATLAANPNLRVGGCNMVGRQLGHEYRLSIGTTWGVHYVCGRDDDEDAADYFFEHLLSGVDVPAGSPILALRKRFIDHYGKRNIMRYDEQAALLIKAFNLFRAEKSISILRWTPADESFPRIGTISRHARERSAAA